MFPHFGGGDTFKSINNLLNALGDKDFDRAQGFFNEYVKIRKNIYEMILNTIPFESDATNVIQKALR